MPDNPCIVVIDDDQSVQEGVLNLLRSSGFEAIAFASAEEFLSSDALKRAACLVVDVQMPGMGGIGLQNHLATTNRNIPIIFITAHPSDAVSKKALQSGAIAFLVKPFSEADFINGIQTALKFSDPDHDRPLR